MAFRLEAHGDEFDTAGTGADSVLGHFEGLVQPVHKNDGVEQSLRRRISQKSLLPEYILVFFG